MGELLKQLLTEVKNQVLGYPSDTPRLKLKYSNKCRTKMKELGLTEADVEDVFRRGVKQSEMLVRSFNGYEIGMYYFQDNKTGEYIATAVWRRERR
jgi:hypothetical protein